MAAAAPEQADQTFVCFMLSMSADALASQSSTR